MHKSSDITLKDVRVIGEYLLGDTSGHGAFCKVKEGINTKTAVRVAVKIIKTPYLRRGSGSISVIMRWVGALFPTVVQCSFSLALKGDQELLWAKSHKYS